MLTKHQEITALILKDFFEVYRKLGYGLLEKVYRKPIMIELRKVGLRVAEEVSIPVYYDGQLISEYIADWVVEDKIILELKAVKVLPSEAEAQLLNYLKSTRYEVGLLLNFGPRPETKRKVYDNERKGNLGWTTHATS